MAGATSYSVTELTGSGGTQIGNTYRFSNLTPGEEVSIEVTANGNTICGDTASVAICAANNCPPISLSIDPINDICLDAATTSIPLAVVVSGSDGTGIGTWSGNGVSDTIFNPQLAGEGTHELTYTFTEFQCNFTASVFVDVYFQPIAIAGDDQHLDCAQTSVILVGDNSSNFGNPVWTTTTGSFVGANDILNPEIDAPGTYVLTITNGTCFASDSLVVTQDINLPLADAGMEQTITCNQSCVTLGGNNTSTGNNFSYAWTGPNGFLSTEIQPTVCDSGLYILTVFDSLNSCFSATSSVQILENTTSPVSAVEAFGNLDCATLSILLDGSNSTSGGQFEYQWSNGTGEIIGATTPTYETSEEGNYYLQVTNMVTGCIALDSVLINNLTAYPIAEIATPEVLTCDILEITLDASASSSAPTIGYQWNGPVGGISSGEQTTTPNITLPGIYELTVLDSTNSCETTTTINVLQNIATPNADAGQDIELECNEFNAMLGSENTSSGTDFVYLWTSSNPASTISNPDMLNPMVEGLGVYTLMVENIENGCTATDEIVVAQNPDVPQNMNVQVLESPCFGDDQGIISVNSIDGGMQPYVYSLNGNTFSAGNIFNNLTPGTYDILAQDINGCEISTTVELDEPELLTLDLGDNITIELGDSLTLNPVTTGLIDTLIWTPDNILNGCPDAGNCWNPSLTPVQMTSVTATVSNENGCSATDQLTIFVEKKRYVYIPNAFSPTGQEENRIFMIYAGKGVERVNTFRVFSRWGELMYEADDFLPNDAAMGWDGNFRGKKMNPGVYIYLAEIEFSDGLKVMYKGDVTLTQ